MHPAEASDHSIFVAPAGHGARKQKEMQSKMWRGCNKNFRNTFYQLSFTSIRLCPWARTVYDELRLRGKSHSAVLRAIGNKWAKIVYAMWQNDKLRVVSYI